MENKEQTFIYESLDEMVQDLITERRNAFGGRESEMRRYDDDYDVDENMETIHDSDIALAGILTTLWIKHNLETEKGDLDVEVVPFESFLDCIVVNETTINPVRVNFGPGNCRTVEDWLESKSKQPTYDGHEHIIEAFRGVFENVTEYASSLNVMLKLQELHGFITDWKLGRLAEDDWAKTYKEHFIK